MSTRESILAAIATALSGLAGGRVYRERREQITTLPAINILPQDDDGSEGVIGKMDALLTVAVEVLANGDIPSQAADSVLASVWSALAAAPTLGLGSEVQLRMSRRVEWDFEEFDYVKARLLVTYQFRTATGSM